ncbi:MerR family transcriptional regulator [Paenibacillus psychroresistens]|nr:MerR family transcriptional regulator [Paenibacillus psychroresistens]
MQTKSLRPIDIAIKIGMSTSALRHYEAWGIIPSVPRSETDYRLYSKEHEAYFVCIRSMNSGFCMALTCKVMRLLIQRDVKSALWIVNEACAELNQEWKTVNRTILTLKTINTSPKMINRKKRASFTIKEAALETGVTATTIRYWEKIGIIECDRDQANGYRSFSAEIITQILLIQSLKYANYSLEAIKQVLSEMKNNNIAKAIEIAEGSLLMLDKRNQDQLSAVAQLLELCRFLRLV